MIKFEMGSMRPVDGQSWATMSLTLNNMRSLRIVADGKEFEGSATMDSVDGHVVIEVGKPAKKVRKAA